MDVFLYWKLSAAASSMSEMGPDKMRIPATLESYAMPTPQTLFFTAPIWPAQRVPWWSSESLGVGRSSWSL